MGTYVQCMCAQCLTILIDIFAKRHSDLPNTFYKE
jgi:hypothetical protein